MVTPTQGYTNKIIRNGIFNITELGTNRVLIMPRPATFTLQDGLGGNNEITEVDGQGFITKVANSFSERKPVMTMSFSGRNLDLTALQLNQKTQQISIDLRFPYRMQVRRSLYEASAMGFLGYGLAKDANTRGSYHIPDTGLTVALTQQPYDTFDSATPRSFAIGENFERLFSDDLVTDQNWIILVPIGNYNARGLSEENFGFLEINGICFNSNGRVSIFHVPTCFVNPEGAGITADNQVQVNFDISGIGACQPWNEYEVPVQNFCEAA